MRKKMKRKNIAMNTSGLYQVYQGDQKICQTSDINQANKIFDKAMRDGIYHDQLSFITLLDHDNNIIRRVLT